MRIKDIPYLMIVVPIEVISLIITTIWRWKNSEGNNYSL